MKELLTLIRKSIAIGHETEEEISSHLILQKVPKGRILISIGDTTDKIYFLKNGLIREYYNSPANNSEITTQIVGEGTFFYSTVAYLREKPSERVVETLQDSELISIRKGSLQELIRQFPGVSVFINTILEETLINFEKRMDVLRHRDPIQKLDAFEKLHPELSNRLSSGIIASYLGMAPQTLSTARSKRRKS